MAGEHDFRIEAGDLAFGLDDEPDFLDDVDVIAQDVRTRLVASGIPPELVADDSDTAGTLARIAFEVEKDLRIRPGTARATVTGEGAIEITARTMNGTAITL